VVMNPDAGCTRALLQPGDALPRRPPLWSQNATMALAIDRFGEFSSWPGWDEVPRKDSSLPFAQMQ
jgi:hypothetical protein